MITKSPNVQRSLRVESLEKRELLAFDLVSDFSPRPKSSYPSEILWYEQGSPESGPKYLYIAYKEGAGQEIHAWRPQIAELKTYDVNPGFEGSSPEEMTRFGSHVIFAANGGSEKGRELWMLKNGTTPTLIRDISPGSGSSNPRDFTVHGAWIFFTAEVNGNREMWRSDGTAANTIKIKEINPSTTVGSDPTDLVVLGTELYFSADDGVHGRELWRTNGTPAGTKIVRDIAPSGVSSGVKEITKAGNRIYFSAFTVSTGRELWSSDGTNAGTKLVKNLNGTGFSAFKSSNPEELTAVGDNLYFRATTAAHGSELFRYEPNIFNDVWEVKDIVPGSGSSYPSEITATNGFIYFAANGELWRTNGINSGTIRVQTLNNFEIGTGPEHLFYQDGFVYYQASNPWLSQELWITNANTGATVFREINSSISGSSYPEHFAKGDGRVYFSADNGQEGVELFSIAGSGTPTMSVNLNLGNGDSAFSTTSFNQNNAVLNGWSYFIVRSEFGDANLWRHQPTTGELVQVSSGSPQWVTNVQAASGTVYFTSYTSPASVDIWKTTGNAPTLVKSISYGSGTLSVRATYVLGDAVYFIMEEFTNNQLKLHLWRSIGNSAGTVEIQLPENTLYHQQGLAVGNSLYLSVNIGNEIKLVKVDGMSLVTVPNVKLIGDYFIKLGTNLVFSGYMGSGEFGLHITNGTAAGTQLLKAGVGVGSDSFAELGGKLYFRGHANGAEPWISDGTTTGTMMLRNINVGEASSDPEEFIVVGNRIFFVATSAANGRELWKSTGTTIGTVLVKSLADGTQSSNPRNLVKLGGMLYFFASIGAPGFESDRLFNSDGTSTGTKQVSTSGSSVAYEAPGQVLFANGNNLYFEAKVLGSQKIYGVEPIVYKAGLVFPGASLQLKATLSDSATDLALASMGFDALEKELKKRSARSS